MSHSFRLSCLSQQVLRTAMWFSIVSLFIFNQCAISLHAQTATEVQLQQRLEPLANAHAGDVSVSVRVLDEANNVTSQWHYHGQRVMPTASLIKLPVMLEAYRQAAAGEVSLDDMLTLKAEDQVPGSGILSDHFSAGLSLSLRDAIRLMIRYSDNTATNLVVDQIGLSSTAKTMAELGWPETQLHSKVFRRETSIAPQRSELYGLGSTTAEDMTDLLVRLERGELVSPEACQAMLEHLLTCDDTSKLPRDLPDGFKVAHKTGSVNRSRTAAGVVSGPGVKFAICVLTDKNEDTSWSDDNAAQVLIGKMARTVVDEIRSQARQPRHRGSKSNATHASDVVRCEWSSGRVAAADVELAHRGWIGSRW